MEKRILAIDYGDRRVGLAVSDPTGVIATGLPTIDRNKLKRGLEAEISDLTERYDVTEIVVGMPVNMDGSMGNRAEIVTEFCERLQQTIGLPVHVWDERLTTVRASSILSEMGVKAMQKKDHVDRVSAQLILQGYLDSKKGCNFNEH